MWLWEIILGPYGFLLCSTLLFRKQTCPSALYSFKINMGMFCENTLLGYQEFCSLIKDNCSGNVSWPVFVENTYAGRSSYALTLVFILQISCWFFSSHRSASISHLSDLTHLSCWLLVGRACDLFQANTCAQLPPLCGLMLWTYLWVFTLVAWPGIL